MGEEVLFKGSWVGPCGGPLVGPRRGALEGIEIRADRFDIGDHLKIEVHFEGVSYPVLNASETGFCFETKTSYAVGTVLPPLRLLLETDSDRDGEIYQGRGKIVRSEAAPNGGFAYGVLLLTGPIDENLFHALETVHGAHHELAREMDQHLNLPRDFLMWVMDLRSYLSTLKAKVDAIEQKAFIMSQSGRESYAKAMETVLAPYVTKTMTEFGRRGHDIVKSMPSKEVLAHAKAVFRRELDDFFKHAPFIERARRKPLGYAGDFEMMNQIYRNEFEGTTLFGGLLHKWGTNEASSLSVRYRRAYFHKRFMQLVEKGDPVTIASIAAGPAKEIVDFVGEASPEALKAFTFVIVDQDKAALLNAKRHINKTLLKREVEANVIYVPTSVRQILEGSDQARKLASLKFDLIYSVGLYDYLTQPVAKLLTKELTRWLVTDGQLVIGNFHPANPTHTISEFAADWSLVLRTERDLRDLCEGLPLNHVVVEKDDQGIELFLNAQRTP